jgi:hypothetical protein
MLFPIKHKKKYGLIDGSGRVVVPARFDFAIDDSWGYGVVADGSRWVIFSNDGSKKGSVECDLVSRFRYGLALVDIGDKCGYCNSVGELVVPAVYDFGRPHTEIGAVVRRDGMWGLIDAEGKLIQEFRHDQIGNVFSESEGLFSTEQSGRYGYLDRNSRWVVPPAYGHGNSFSEGVAAVWNEGRWAFIDKVGRQVTGFDYTLAQNYSCGLCTVAREGLSGMYYIDAKGTPVSEAYTACKEFVEGLSAVYVGGEINIHNFAEGGRWVVVDTKFRTVYDNKLTGVELLPGGLVRIYTGATFNDEARMGYIDRMGNVVWKPSR